MANSLGRHTALFLFCLFFVQSYGQNIANYTVSGANGTYNTIVGTVPSSTGSSTGDNLTFANIPIGFEFWYTGQRYTSVSASMKGWFTFGSSITNSSPVNNLSSGGNRPVIAPLWDDIARIPGIINLIAQGRFSYSTTGTAGGKRLILQWNLMRWDLTAPTTLTIGGDIISFQAILYEATGNIEFVYRPESQSVSNGSASVGITAVAAGSGNFISLNSIATTSATPAYSTSSETANISTKPTSVRSVLFDPVELAVPTALNFSRVGSTGFTIHWTDNSIGEIGFVIYRSTDGGSTYSYLATAPANATSHAETGLTNGSTYHYRVYTLRENLSATFAAGSQQANCQSFAIGVSPNVNGAGNNGPVCVGYVLTLTVNTVDGATYSWIGPNGFSTAVQNPNLTYSDAARGTYTVTVTRNGCTATATTTVSSMGEGRWTGVAGSSWTTADNWCNGMVPTAATNVIVPTSEVGNEPVLTTTASVNNIMVQAGRTLTIANGANLQVAGAITNAGSIMAAAGKVTFNGVAAQHIPANTFAANTILNLELNNTAGITLLGTLRITGLLTATAGIFNTNGFLTLASSETTTAQVAPILTPTAAVSGRVNVERFVKGGPKEPYRTYRMLSSPVYDNTPLLVNVDAEGNRSAKFTQLIDDIIITGSGGAANGFDVNLTNNASAWTYNNGFVAVPNINTSVNAGRGLYFYFRGNRDNFLAKTQAPYVDPENVLVDFEGVLNQQDVTVSLNTVGFHLLGNPYASTIDWLSPNWADDKVNVANAIWIWNPSARAYATFTDGIGTLNGSRYISSGQAFFVRTSTAGSIKFKESVKTVTEQLPPLLMSMPASQSIAKRNYTETMAFSRSLLRIGLSPITSYGKDETILAFGEGYDPNYNEEDALHFDGEIVNISTLASGQKLAINFLPSFTQTMEIPMHVNAAATGNYLMNFNLQEYSQGHALKLRDNYLQQVIPIIHGSVHNFSIDRTNNATFGAGRFSIIVEPPVVLPVGLQRFTALKQNDAVQLLWVTTSEIGHYMFKLYRAGDDGIYIWLSDFPPKEGGTYTYLDASPLRGYNYYKLVQVDLSGKQMVIDPIAVNFDIESSGSVTVFPNPVKDKLTIKANGLQAEKFKLDLHDISGKILQSYVVSKADLSNGYEVNVSLLSTGLLFVKIEELGLGKPIITHKILKY